MTKTLTEQWRDGTLPQGNYYVNAKNIYNGDLYKGEIDHFNGEAHWFRFAGVEEILAPVPSYDEWHKVKDLGLRPDYTDHIEKWEDCARLTKKLEIATKALKRYSKDDYYSEGGGRSVNPYPDIARKALKEMEGVK